MTNKNKRSRSQHPHQRPSGPFRGTATTPQRHCHGEDSSTPIFTPAGGGRDVDAAIRSSLARGVVTVAGTPVLASSRQSPSWRPQWLGALALGYEGPFALFVSALALPPVGTSFDATLSTALFGLRGGFFAILGFVVLRAVVQALLVAAIVEVLRASPLGRWTVGPGALHTLPVTLAVNVAGVGLLTLGEPARARCSVPRSGC